MLLEAGVKIAADGRLIEASNLQVRESALTGEALPVTKQADIELEADASLGDRLNWGGPRQLSPAPGCKLNWAKLPPCFSL